MFLLWKFSKIIISIFFDYDDNLVQVCTREERQTIISGTREGKKLEKELLSRQFREHEGQSLVGTNDQSSQLSLNEIAQAVAYKDRLIEFDRTRFC